MGDNTAQVPMTYYVALILTLMLSPIMALIVGIRELFHRSKEHDIKGEVAVITGAARGLGREIAIALAKRGCHIAVLDILEDASKETAKYLSEAFKIKAKPYKVDVSNHDELIDFHRSVIQDFGDVTILINNAGLLSLADSNPLDFEEIQKIITVNFTSHLWMNQLFLPRMKELNRGHIMAISSLSALVTAPFVQIYAPTKSAVTAYMASLRADMKSGKYGIKVTTIMPTFLNTNQQVNEFISFTGYDKWMPPIDGAGVAQQAVQAMLQGLEEITLPRIASFIFKLHGLYPTWLRDGIQGLLGAKVQVVELRNKLASQN
uniref:Uncharacterized protein n=1 Tax=Stomoxys calcitrans TaxID=35570 RepID=A0A1I8PNX0_STOCA